MSTQPACFFPTFTLRKHTPFLHIERCDQNTPHNYLSALSLRAAGIRERYFQLRLAHNLRRLFACILCLYFIHLPSVWRLTDVIWQSKYSRMELKAHWLHLMPDVIYLLIHSPCYFFNCLLANICRLQMQNRLQKQPFETQAYMLLLALSSKFAAVNRDALVSPEWPLH